MMDSYTLPLEGFDVILDVQWLKSLGPIVWDFTTLSMAFLRNGRSVCLHGCGGSPNTLCSVSQQDDMLASLLNAYVDILKNCVPYHRNADTITVSIFCQELHLWLCDCTVIHSYSRMR
jgi:hypothetical protein